MIKFDSKKFLNKYSPGSSSNQQSATGMSQPSIMSNPKRQILPFRPQPTQTQQLPTVSTKPANSQLTDMKYTGGRFASNQMPAQPSQQSGLINQKLTNDLNLDKNLLNPQTPTQTQQPSNRFQNLQQLLNPQTPAQPQQIMSKEEFERRMAFKRPESPGGLQTKDVKPEEAFQSQFRNISYDDYVNAGGQLTPELKERQMQMIREQMKLAKAQKM
jgi:hypothetical protein